MKWSDFDKYLKAEHLDGKSVVVTLDKIVIEETHPKPGVTQKSPVAYFVGKSKGLILSSTNQDTLQDMFGDAVDACVGKRVILRAVTVDAFGKKTTPVRIFPTIEQTELEQAAQEPA